MARKVLIIGVGNRYRRDDAAGLHCVARIADHALPGVDTASCEGDPMMLVDLWHGAWYVVIVDATISGTRPGAIQRLEVKDLALCDDTFCSSTHGMGLSHVIDLAGALGRLPQRLILYGVEGADFLIGEGLSPEVEQGVCGAAQMILDDIRF